MNPNKQPENQNDPIASFMGNLLSRLELQPEEANPVLTTNQAIRPTIVVDNARIHPVRNSVPLLQFERRRRHSGSRSTSSAELNDDDDNNNGSSRTTMRVVIPTTTTSRGRNFTSCRWDAACVSQSPEGKQNRKQIDGAAPRIPRRRQSETTSPNNEHHEIFLSTNLVPPSA